MSPSSVLLIDTACKAKTGITAWIDREWAMDALMLHASLLTRFFLQAVLRAAPTPISSQASPIGCTAVCSSTLSFQHRLLSLALGDLNIRALTHPPRISRCLLSVLGARSSSLAPECATPSPLLAWITGLLLLLPPSPPHAAVIPIFSFAAHRDLPPDPRPPSAHTRSIFDCLALLSLPSFLPSI